MKSLSNRYGDIACWETGASLWPVSAISASLAQKNHLRAVTAQR
jgi:hypothetical protein